MSTREAGDLAESINAITTNFARALLEWKHLNEDIRKLVDDTDSLVNKLERKDLLHKETARRYTKVKKMSLKSLERHLDFLREKYLHKKTKKQNIMDAYTRGVLGDIPP